MYLANGKIKKKYNIVDERAELQTVLKEWIDAVGEKQFLHGDKITMPDLMVYGVLHAIDGFETFKQVMHNNTSLHQWYMRVESKLASKK
jgi:glutathione S-transferase